MIVPHVVPAQPDPLRLHVTAVLLEPVTVAVNFCVDPTPTEADDGVTPTETVVPRIVTAVDPLIDGFDNEVAVTVTILGVGVVAGPV